jgi:hypothetical protein
MPKKRASSVSFDREVSPTTSKPMPIVTGTPFLRATRRVANMPHRRSYLLRSRFAASRSSSAIDVFLFLIALPIELTDLADYFCNPAAIIQKVVEVEMWRADGEVQWPNRNQI